MLRCIHHSLALAKQLSGLRRAGKKAESAADKADAIVQDIRQHGCHRYDSFAPDTLLYRSEECVIAEDALAADCHESLSAKAMEDDYEEVLAAKLEESHLKAVFQGLFSQPPSLPEKTGKVKAQKPATGRFGKAMGVI